MSRLPETPMSWDGELLKLEGHKAGVHAVAFSPDGQIVASTSAKDDPTVRLWNPATGEQLHELKGHEDAVFDVAFYPSTPTGMLASCSKDRTVILWDSTTGEQKQVIHCNEELKSVAFSPDGLLGCAGGEEIMIWDKSTKEQPWVVQVVGSIEVDSVEAIKFNPNREFRVLAVSIPRSRIELWNYSGKQRISKFPTSGFVHDLAFSSDGKLLASASQDMIELWSVEDKNRIRDLKIGSRSAFGVVFGPKENQLVSTHYIEVKLWNTETALETMSFPAKTSAMALSPDGRTIALASWGGYSTLWDIASSDTESPRIKANPVTDCVASADGSRFAWLSRVRLGNTIMVWDMSMEQEVRKVECGYLSVPILSPDGHWLVYRKGLEHGEQNLMIVDLTGRIDEWEWGSSCGTSVKAITISSDSRLFALGHADGMASIWDLASGENAAEGSAPKGYAYITSNQSYVTGLAFSYDGQLLAAVSTDSLEQATDIFWRRQTIANRTIGILDITHKGKDEEPRELEITHSPINLAFSNKGRLLAVSSRVEVTIFDLAKPELVPPPRKLDFAHTSIGKFRFSADDQFLVTQRGTLRLPSAIGSSGSPQTNRVPAIHCGEEWITVDDENYLWLPRDNRPYDFGEFWKHRSAFTGNRLAIVTASGRLIFFEFNLKSIAEDLDVAL
jgi:WD40 repeat protein